MANFRFKYGKGEIDINLPDGNVIGVLQGKALTALKDPEQAVKDTLKQPIGCRSFYDVFKAGDKVAIIVSDRTRSIGAKTILPVIVNELNSIGVKDDDIFIMLACGTHRGHMPEEHAKIVGDEMLKRLKVYDHDCRNKSELLFMGTTSRGTRVELNKKVVDADKVILTGAITYHYFAGYGGGRKSVLPGISAFETIQTNHKLLIKKGKVDRKCTTGRLKGNPIHEDMEEAAKMLSPDFLVNTIMADDGKIAAVFSGDFIKAHATGCEHLDEKLKIEIEKKADMVIAAAGGGMKDMNFVQSHKAMENASYALKKGGTMVLIAESAEGLPGDEYAKWINLGSADAILEHLGEHFTIPGHTVHAAFEKAEKFRIIWVTKMDKGIVIKMGIIPKDNVPSALDEAFKAAKEKVSIYVIPQGYSTFPYYPADHKA